MTIYFYSKIDKFGDFSNFAKFGVEMDGKWWSTVEHYYQAMKFNDSKYQEKIRLSDTPKKAKALGFSRKIKCREDWDEIKDDIMYWAVLKKFETHATIRDRLLATGSDEIAESAPGDYYWGCGADGSGLNKLGKIIMLVRNKLREEI